MPVTLVNSMAYSLVDSSQAESRVCHTSFLFILIAVVGVLLPTCAADKSEPRSQAKKPAQGINAQGIKKLAPVVKKPTPTVRKPTSSQSKFTNEQPYQNGAGLVVGEPLSNGGSDLTAFGAACSRWLQFRIGGQGEMGKTPLWREIDEASQEMGKSNFQLTAGDVDGMAKALGPTHMLLGSIAQAENPGEFILRYQLIDVNTRIKTTKGNSLIVSKSVGVIPALQGTKTAIWKELPSLALSLSRQLGVKKPSIGEQSDISEEEMALMGRGHWVFPGKLTQSDFVHLGAIAAREPLAALLTLEYNDRQGFESNWTYQNARSSQGLENFGDSALATQVVVELLKQARENVLAVTEIGLIDLKQLRAYEEESELAQHLLGMIIGHPKNYAMRMLAEHVNSQVHESLDDSTESARRSTLAAPRNPHAWLLFGNHISSQAEKVREGRFANNIEEKGWQVLNAFYDRWNACARRAVELDPNNSYAWRALACSSTFKGDPEVANAAFWKAYRLNPTDSNQFFWGIQQFQPKWNDDPESLKKVIALASEPQHVLTCGRTVWSYLLRNGQTQAAAEILKKVRQIHEREVAEQPDNVQRLKRFIDFKISMGEIPYADFAKLVALRPNSSYALQSLSSSMARAKPAESIPLLRKALEINPRNFVLHRDLGYALMATGHYEEAVRESTIYTQIIPFNSRAYIDLAQAFYKWGKLPEAIKASNKVLELQPDYRGLDFFHRLCDAQFRIGQFEDAIESGKGAVAAAKAEYLGEPSKRPQWNIQRIAWAHALSAWAMFKSGKPDLATAECEQALKLDDINAGAHYCLAEIYLERGQREKAEAEWRNVVDNAGRQAEEPLVPGKYAALAAARLTP
jgi:tetratricopeptide (TPR) repeat protein